jgi:hypothetical protein
LPQLCSYWHNNRDFACKQGPFILASLLRKAGNCVAYES